MSFLFLWIYGNSGWCHARLVKIRETNRYSLCHRPPTVIFGNPFFRRRPCPSTYGLWLRPLVILFWTDRRVFVVVVVVGSRWRRSMARCLEPLGWNWLVKEVPVKEAVSPVLWVAYTLSATRFRYLDLCFYLFGSKIGFVIFVFLGTLWKHNFDFSVVFL